jgi:L-ascorbate metabolism protein UlaG (beta-lactamase superfamily)
MVFEFKRKILWRANMINDVIARINWLGHATLLINLDNKNIYVDPWKLKNTEVKSDIILVSHSHFDHYSEDDIKKIFTDTTMIYSSEDVISKTSLPHKHIIKPFGEVKIGSIIIKGFPAYNINKDFHPKKNNWLGFVIISNDISIYVAGDTDAIEEAKKLKVSVMILPIGGTYSMDFREAAELVNTAKPNYVIPYHYGDIVGSEKDAINFKSLVKYSEVIIKK